MECSPPRLIDLVNFIIHAPNEHTHWVLGVALRLFTIALCKARIAVVKPQGFESYTF